LNSEQRLTRPMLKQGGQWQETDWQTALEYVAHGLRNIRHEHGADAIAALAAPYSTLEEMALLQKVMRGLGSENIDFRPRQSDFALDGNLVPWLGMSIADFSALKRVFVIGSFLRKDHPLLALRLRQSIKRGTKVSALGATGEDWLMPLASRVVAAPSGWLNVLSGVVVAVAQAKNIPAPSGFEGVEPSVQACQIADSLMSGEPRGILLGNAAAQHPQASQLHAAAQWLADATGAKLGYLTEAANSVGGHIANAAPGKGANALQMFAQPRKAYVLMHVEPELDTFNPKLALAALDKAEMVVVMSPYQHGAEYADVLLPIAPFSETAGTFISAEGRVQSFNGAVKPLADTRPGWKVLRVLGNLLGLEGFEYESSEAVRKEVLGTANLSEVNLASRLNNTVAANVAFKPSAEADLERIADVPIYFSDAITRRSPPLQQTLDAQSPKAWIAPLLAQKLGVNAGDSVKVTSGEGSVVLAAAIDAGMAVNAVKVSAAHPSTVALGAMFGALTVEKA
jgi:NADH-quinone oxidoreductase subunit G